MMKDKLQILDVVALLAYLPDSLFSPAKSVQSLKSWAIQPTKLNLLTGKVGLSLFVLLKPINC